jgi:hypothetical protein
MDEGSSHGAIIPLTEKTPQRSCQVRLSLTKGGKGKGERWVWKVESQMNFKESSSRVERERSLGGVVRKAKG